MKCSAYSTFPIKSNCYVLDYTVYFNFFRFYRTVLVHSSDKTKKVKVSVVKLKSDSISLAQIEMLEQEFHCSGNKNGLLCTHTEHGIAVILNVDHVRDPVTLIPIPDGQYDSYEELVTNFSTLDKLMCDYNPPTRNSPAEVIEMSTVLETLQRVDDIVSVSYGFSKSPNGVVQDLVKALIVALRKLGYLTSLFDTPELYSELVQMAVQRFQTEYNAHGAVSTPQLPNNGLLCPNTWKALQDRLANGFVRE